ncbi:cation diffusion facilitator family transporter [Roseitranquillus sediminis]|uniref:cation diffusion facilitator family transporter n=1 Tax=Roseitranquillus sediminis TaxID=2809051 RepID=UPI001D0C1DA4|nr:cation diffusion facilitator family transporter [Roseitranquillus sediminis]MBM9595252.1 cation diffusion facilitator family transporter [Roseitranquillus sediminis]
MPDRATRLNISATLASVGVAATLVALKLWALAETEALSVAVALADSALDLMMSLGGLAAVIYAARPPDEDHAFGHSSAEDLAALGQSAFILVSTAAIAVAAVLRLASLEIAPLAAQGRGIAVLTLSILLTLALLAWQRHVALRTGSRVVKADSLHYLGDLVPNLGGIASLWASAAFGLERLDSVVALGAAAFLAVGAIRIGAGAWDALMDRRADPEVVSGVKALTRDFPGVQGFHDLKTRTAGSRIFVNLHIELEGGQTLDEAHAIGAALKRKIIEAYPNADVIIHKDPV